MLAPIPDIKWRPYCDKCLSAAALSEGSAELAFKKALSCGWRQLNGQLYCPMCLGQIRVEQRYTFPVTSVEHGGLKHGPGTLEVRAFTDALQPDISKVESHSKSDTIIAEEREGSMVAPLTTEFRFEAKSKKWKADKKARRIKEALDNLAKLDAVLTEERRKGRTAGGRCRLPQNKYSKGKDRPHAKGARCTSSSTQKRRGSRDGASPTQMRATRT